MGISVRPSEMSEGGSLDGAVVVLRNPKYVMFDWRDKQDVARGEPTPCLRLDLELDGTLLERPQYYALGMKEDWEISEDGLTFDKADGSRRRQVSKSMNFGRFMTALVEEAGFNEDEVPEDGNCSFLDGLKVEMEDRVVHVTKAGSEKRTLVPVKVLGREDSGDAAETEDAVELDAAALEKWIASLVLGAGEIPRKDVLAKTLIQFKGENKGWKNAAIKAIQGKLVNDSDAWDLEGNTLKANDLTETFAA